MTPSWGEITGDPLSVCDSLGIAASVAAVPVPGGCWLPQPRAVCRSASRNHSPSKAQTHQNRILLTVADFKGTQGAQLPFRRRITPMRRVTPLRGALARGPAPSLAGSRLGEVAFTCPRPPLFFPRRKTKLPCFLSLRGASSPAPAPNTTHVAGATASAETSSHRAGYVVVLPPGSVSIFAGMESVN